MGSPGIVPVVALALLFAPVAARAQAPALAPARVAPDEPEAPPPPPAVPDAVFRAMRGKVVTLELRGRPPVTGQLVADDATSVTVIALVGGEVIALPRADITRVLGTIDEGPAGAAGSPGARPGPPPPPDKARHVGLQLGVLPSLMVDVEYGLFYGFAAASVFFPLATNGDWLAGSIGAGAAFPLSSSSRWKLDVFASASPARVDVQDGVFVGVGVGLGFHTTLRNGLTVGFKLPVLGYSVGQSTTSVSDGFARYYVSAAMGLPVFSLGYRF